MIDPGWRFASLWSKAIRMLLEPALSALGRTSGALQ
jgi:hypothetical protein